MNGELFQLALQGIRRRRKTSLLLFLVLCLSFAFAVISLAVTSSMEATNQNFRLETYGRWEGAVVEGQEEDEEFLNQQEWLSELGASRRTGALIGEKGSVNFGTVDEGFISLGNLGLQDGHWPEADNEIVMEANSLNALGFDYELGQELTVTVSLPATGPKDGSVKVEHTFILSGVIKSYTGLWHFSQYQQGAAKQHLNSALISAETVELLKKEGEAQAEIMEEQAREVIDALKAEGEEPDAILLGQTNISLNTIGPVYIFAVKNGRDEEMKTAMEEYLVGGEEKRAALSINRGISNASESEEKAFQYFYAILVFAVMVFAILCIYALQLPKQVRQIALFRSIGIKKRQLRKLAMFENLILCVPALILGAGLGALGTLGALRLLFYSGSAPIAVALPWTLLGILAAVWVLGVFLARLIILQIALREPLIGRIAINSKKAKRLKYAQTALITALASLLCGVSVFTVMETLRPQRNAKASAGYNSYAIYGTTMIHEFDNQLPPAISPAWKKLAETVPGIDRSTAACTMVAEITFEGMENSDYYQAAKEAEEKDVEVGLGEMTYSPDAVCVTMRAMPNEELDETIDFEALGVDKEAFLRGEEVIVGVQKDVDGSYLVNVPIPPEDPTVTGYGTERRHCKDPVLKTGDTVRLNVYGRPWPGQEYSFKGRKELYEFSSKAVVVVEDATMAKRLAWEPYEVLCSYDFMEKIYNEMEPGFDSFNTITGGEFGYVYLYLSTNQDAGYLATDAVIASMCQEKGFYLNSFREEMAALAQETMQKLILLYTGGGCVLLILLIVLGNTLSMEREREKHHYGVLQSLGMSKKQMRQKILKTALFRGLLGAVMGWALFGAYLLADAPRQVREEALMAEQQWNQVPRFTTIWGALAETIRNFQIDGANLWLVLGLTLAFVLVIAGLSLLCKRQLFKNDLMEKLRSEE